MGHPTDDGWCDCEPPTHLTDKQIAGDLRGAEILGGVVCYAPPSPDSLLGWALAHPGFTREELNAERARRGLLF